jgi:two-component system chemotaxis sensor kinase CheA
MDDLIGEFIAESREMLDAIEGSIVAWEATPDDRARLDEIFRFVHTVKGNCGFFDLPRIKALSHAAEDCLAELRSGTRTADARLVSAVLAVIDRIGELVEALGNGGTVEAGDEDLLIAALQAREEFPGTLAQANVPIARAAPRTIRLPVELLDRMMSGVSDLVLARNELGRTLRDHGTGIDVDAAFERVSGAIADMRDAITRTRMQRIDTLFGPLPRIVRDISAELHKKVCLSMEGGEVELDREMLEMIRDPLTHIVRNAIDHGIEAPEERGAKGKRPAGMLAIRARQSGNQILVEVEDDGRGVDAEALAARAIAAGMLSAVEADRLSQAQKCGLLFEPGLSTAAQVTAISGRGVGMDVVRSNIERVGGLIDLDSRPGAGLRLTLRVPLTLTIIPALTVLAGGERYAIPRSAIEEIVRVSGKAVRLERIGGAGYAIVRGTRVPMLSLPDLLGVDHAAPEAERSLILLRPGASDIYALAVDRFCDHEELVVKPAAPAIMAAGLYAGTTLGDDGRPILLLDPAGIAARAGLRLGERVREAAVAPEEQAGASHILFKSLAGAVRLAPLGAAARIEEVPAEAVRFSAGRLHVTLGDRLLPLAGCEHSPSGALRVLRLSDGVSELAYAIAEVIDILPFNGKVRPAPIPGEVRGVALVSGEQVELLDLYWLFEAHGATQEGERPACVLPEGDPWMEMMLRPMIESAGYRVISAGHEDAGSAAVFIIDADDPCAPAPPVPGRVVKIRSQGGADDGSIHRYDRAALMEALRSGGRAKG